MNKAEPCPHGVYIMAGETAYSTNQWALPVAR